MASLVGGEIDERVVARASLEAAEEQLQTLCASHAGTFVSVERRGQALETSLNDLLESVQGNESLVTNAKQCIDQEEEEKENSLASLSERHRVRRRTLLQHSSLLELLELPSLMDACVRSNLYDEALSIAGFSNTLERRHKENNVVVAKVVGQIRSRQMDLRRHLLFRLKQHVTMPQCLEVVTALRQLNSIDLERQSEVNLERVHSAMELRLQIDFLEARDAWLDSPSSSSSSSLSSSSSSTTAKTSTTSTATDYNKAHSVRSSEQLLDTIERYRTRVFEIATQFNAIFRAQIANNSSQDTGGLLSMWTSRRVYSFLNMLSLQLGNMDDSASLRDALEACVFFSTSLGRLGADFTAQLPPLFESRAHAIIENCWKDGAQQLTETLKVCRNAGVVSPLVSSQVSSSGTALGTTSETTTDPTAADSMGTTTATSTSTDGPMPPPRILMTLPPLARFVNSILMGLNDLRRCLLPGIFLRLRESLRQLMQQVRSMLQMNERAVNAPGFHGEAAQLREVATRMKKMFVDVVEPYVLGSLEMALGNDEGAETFHQSLREIKKKIQEKKEEDKEKNCDDILIEEEEEGKEEEEEGKGKKEETAEDEKEDSTKNDTVGIDPARQQMGLGDGEKDALTVNASLKID